MRYTEKEITEFTNVGYGKKATARIEAGVNYKELVLMTTNVDPDQVEYVTVKVGSDKPFDLSGDVITAIQEHKNEVQDATVWLIPFLDRAAVSMEGQEKSSLQTLRGENVQIEIKLAARKSPAQDALEPEILGITVSGEPVHDGKGNLVRQYMPRSFEMIVPIGKTGKNTFSDFDNQQNHLLRRMFIKSTDITRIEVIVNNVERLNVSVPYMHYMQKRAGLKIPAGYTVFDPMYSGFNWSDMLNVTGKIEFVFHTTTTTDLVAYCETLKAVNQLG